MDQYTDKISVIMAARNSAPYLQECMESILSQTYNNWELIAVNDHSTDDTLEILNEYARADHRIRVISSEREKLIPALKEGYAISTGNLINRMDSDDIMPDYKLEVMYEKWKKHGKGYIVAGGTRHFSDSGDLGEGFEKYDAWLNNVARENSHYKEIYKECVLPSHCWLIHRDDFESSGAFDPEIYPEDYDLCFRFYQNGLKIRSIDKVLHHWRDRPDRISRTWDVYKDNRYFDLKLKYFLAIDRDESLPLVLWGGGKNGKDLARKLNELNIEFKWATGNPNKTGKEVYGIVMMDEKNIPDLGRSQILIVVSSETDKSGISVQLKDWGKKPAVDYWHFI